MPSYLASAPAIPQHVAGIDRDQLSKGRIPPPLRRRGGEDQDEIIVPKGPPPSLRGKQVFKNEISPSSVRSMLSTTSSPRTDPDKEDCERSTAPSTPSPPRTTTFSREDSLHLVANPPSYHHSSSQGSANLNNLSSSSLSFSRRPIRQQLDLDVPIRPPSGGSQRLTGGTTFRQSSIASTTSSSVPAPVEANSPRRSGRGGGGGGRRSSGEDLDEPVLPHMPQHTLDSAVPSYPSQNSGLNSREMIPSVVVDDGRDVRQYSSRLLQQEDERNTDDEKDKMIMDLRNHLEMLQESSNQLELELKEARSSNYHSKESSFPDKQLQKQENVKVQSQYNGDEEIEKLRRSILHLKVRVTSLEDEKDVAVKNERRLQQELDHTLRDLKLAEAAKDQFEMEAGICKSKALAESQKLKDTRNLVIDVLSNHLNSHNQTEIESQDLQSLLSQIRSDEAQGEEEVENERPNILNSSSKRFVVVNSKKPEDHFVSLGEVLQSMPQEEKSAVASASSETALVAIDRNLNGFLETLIGNYFGEASKTHLSSS